MELPNKALTGLSHTVSKIFSQQELAMKDVVSPIQATACARVALVASFLMLGTIDCSSDASSPHEDELGPSSGTGGVIVGAGGSAGVAGGSGGGVPLPGSGGVQPSGGVGGMPVSGGVGGIPPSAGGVPGSGGVATGGDAGFAGAGATGAGGSTAGPVLPPVTSVDMPGPFTTTIDQNTGPTGSAWVARPSTLGEGGLLHPIFLWGPGAGATPSSYQDHLNYWASHGFVVYSIVSTGNGSEIIAGIDWLVAQNTQAGSPYFGMLDTNRIAAGGHSRGSLSTFGAAGDPRLTTTIHVAGGSFDGNGSSSLHAPAAYICGSADTLATPNCERDYDNTTVPVFFTVMQGVDHIMAARSGLPAITAWLRWHLGGEEERRGMFLDPNCTFCTGMWVSQSKNW